jgi:MFS family permease
MPILRGIDLMLRLPSFDNVTKVTLVYFCTRFHLYIHAYALILLQRGLSLVEISTIESVVIATIFLAEVPTGVLADRLGRKWAVMLSTVFLMLGELIFLFSTHYTQYLILAVFTGIGFAFGSGAIESLIYDSLPADNRSEHMTRAMGRYHAVGQVAFFLSPIVGALILGELAADRVQVVIFLTVMVLVVGVLISLTLREPPKTEATERQSARAIFVSGLAELRQSPRLQRIVLLLVFTMPFGGALVTTLAPPYMDQNGVPPFWVGLALSFGSLLAALAQANVHRIERILGERNGLVALTLLPGVMYLLLASAAGAPPVWLIITFMYATNDLKAPLFSAKQNALISDGSRATVLSMINMVVNLFVAIAAPIYAALAMRSLPLAFAAIGAVIIGASALLRIDRTVELKSS